MEEKKICYLIGHKIGELNDSGYPVCERCGAHSYYDEEIFTSGGILMRPVYFMNYKINQIKCFFSYWYWKIVSRNKLPF